MIAPCLNCPDRKLLCHSSCDRYKEYVELVRQINENRKRILNNDAFDKRVLKKHFERRKI